MKKLSVLILYILSLYAHPTFAYKSYGAGNESCVRWVNNKETGAYYVYRNWVLGYVSSYGFYGKRNLKEVDSEALFSWMDNYCRENPFKSIEDGTKELIKALVIQK